MAVEQGIAISIGGGLDKTSSSYDLFKTPGVATRLKNFEASLHGGYRRVNGYRKFLSSPVISVTVTGGGTGYDAGTTVAFTDEDGNGTGAAGTVTVVSGVITAVTVTSGGTGYQTPPTVSFHSTGHPADKAVTVAVLNTESTPSGGTTPIKGVYAYADGGWACQNGNIYWSEDGYTWIQVNKDVGTCSSGGLTTQRACEESNASWTASWATVSDLTTATAVALNADGRYTFSEYIPASVPNARITAVNGADAPVYLETKLEGGVRKFKFYRGLYDTFGLSKSTPVYADIPKPQYVTTHDDHTVIAGWADKPETLYYSTRYDDADFTGASAGQINTGDELTGVRTFRSELVVFGRNSLSKLLNISSSANIALVDITKNIGCVDGFSIQEIGGDLVFLAPDGIRTVAATARIDDIELSSISHKILPIINDIVNNIHKYDLSSVVIRTQNQYRLFYCNATTGKLAQKGIIGTFKISPQGLPVWEWAETQGISVTTLTSGFDSRNVERAYHGDYQGYVHMHNVGNTFDGSLIDAVYKTPDIDYGDIGIRKTLHFTKLSIKPEGETDINLDVRYDFEDPEIPQPSVFPLGSILAPSLFGYAIFGTSKFGTPEVPMKRLNLWGSGFSNSFKFSSKDTHPPYSIQGMYVDLIPSGRR